MGNMLSQQLRFRKAEALEVRSRAAVRDNRMTHFGVGQTGISG